MEKFNGRFKVLNMNIDRIINSILRTKFGMFGFCAAAFFGLLFCSGCFPCDMLGCFCACACGEEDNIFEDCSDEVDSTCYSDSCIGDVCFSDYGCYRDCANGYVHCGGCNESLCYDCGLGCGGSCGDCSCEFMNCSYNSYDKVVDYTIKIKDKNGNFKFKDSYYKEFTDIDNSDYIDIYEINENMKYFNVESINIVSVPNNYKVEKCTIHRNANYFIVKDDNDNIIEEGNIELEIIVSEKHYGESINLDYYVDNKHVSSSQIKVGIKGEDLYSPVKVGHTFVGWYTTYGTEFNFDGNSFHYYNNANLEGNSIELYAKFERNLYTIFLENNGSNLTFEVPYKYKLSSNEVLMKYIDSLVIPENKHFDSWIYEGMNYTTEEIKDLIIYNNIEIKAYYKNIYTITIHNIKGFLEETQTISVIEDEPVYLNQFRISEYYEKWRFAGFFKDSEFKYFEQDVVSASSNMDIYLKWEELSRFNIKYYDGENLIASETYLINEGKDLIVPTAPLGYKFVGWCKNKDLTDVPIMFLPETEYGNKELYAKFDPKQYEIKLYPVGGTIDTDSVTLTFNETFTLPVPSRVGFVFSGWYINNTERITDENGNSFAIFAEQYQSISEGIYQAFAKWEVKKLNIDYIYNNGESDVVFESYKVDYGKNPISCINSPSKVGYDFVGWYDLNGNQFDETVQIIEDTIYIAKFEPKIYTITLDLLGGNIEGESNSTVNIYYDTKVSLPVPEKEGCIFIGWEDSNGKLYTGADGKMLFNYTLTEDIVLYAKWL